MPCTPTEPQCSSAPSTPTLPDDPPASKTSLKSEPHRQTTHLLIEPFTATLPNDPEDERLQLLLTPPPPSPPWLSDDSSDSQLTDDEQSEPHRQTSTAELHPTEEDWTTSKKFWQGVDDMLRGLSSQP